MNTMLTTVQESIRRAARTLGYSDGAIEKFLKPEHEHSFVVEVGGKQYPAYRVQHNSKLGPYKGGIRFHPGVTLDEVRALATLMSLKTAAVGLPLGGGKGGVVVDPRALSDVDLEELSRAYARQLSPYIGSDKDIPAPDVNTNGRIMDWMLDEFEKTTGKKDPGCFTGKTLGNGGSEGRVAATGYGAVVVLAEYLKQNGLTDKALTLGMQGFGNAGYYFAKGMRESCPNVRLVAIANSKHTWVNRDGFDVTKTSVQGKDPRPEELDDIAQATVLPSNAVLAERVDILALAALEDAVNDTNVDSVQAQTVVELANGPVTDKAATSLFAKGVSIIPDVVANAGGVIVSCLEWQQNLKHEHWSVQKVHQAMSDMLLTAATDMLQRAKDRGISYKEAAFELALERLLR